LFVATSAVDPFAASQARVEWVFRRQPSDLLGVHQQKPRARVEVDLGLELVRLELGHLALQRRHRVRLELLERMVRGGEAGLRGFVLLLGVVERDQRRGELLFYVGQLDVFVSALVLHGLQSLHLLLRGTQSRQARSLVGVFCASHPVLCRCP
jgi:hypothetical protein